MAYTINELIYNIKNQLKIARPDDIVLSDRQVEFMCNYIREKLIVQQLQKGRSISSNIKQDLGQVEVIKIDEANSGELLSGKPIFRTIDKVPQPIELDQMDLFTYIGGLDKHSAFSYKTKAAVRWNKYTKYASKTPLSYYSDGYIFVTNCPNPLLEYINIEGVFANPREVKDFKSPEGKACYNPDTDSYPISGRMIDMMNKLIKEGELNMFMQLQEDTTNNADSKT